MMWPQLKRCLRLLVGTAAAAVAVVAMAPSNEADASGAQGLEFSFGDASKGFLTVPIYRAGIVPDEFLVVATPGNCQRSVQVSLSWNEAENWVRARIQGKGVLERQPTIDRTEGVNFFPNPNWPEPEDFENGRYLFWLITSPGSATFYYDVNTLELLGSQFDFETPPIPSIPVDIPYFAAVPTPFFQPDENGDIDFVYEWAYDALVRPDFPELAHTFGTFAPPTLCKADPYRYDRTSTRPFVSARPASEALSWPEFLENSLAFDITIEPPDYFNYPPTATNVGAYQGTLGIAGNVPKGWRLNQDAFFGSIAPPISPLPTAPFPGQECEDWFSPPNSHDFNICGPQGGGQ